MRREECEDSGEAEIERQKNSQQRETKDLEKEGEYCLIPIYCFVHLAQI